MSKVSYEVSNYIIRLNEIIRELEAIERELPSAMEGVKTSKLCRELRRSADRYKKVRDALYRID